MEDISTWKIVYLIIVVLVTLIVYKKAGKKYDAMIVPLDKKDYGLKDFYPIGLEMLQIVKYQYNTNFDRKLIRQLRELFNPDFADYWLRIYWAGAVSYVFIAFLMSAMLNIGMGTLGLFFGLGLGGIMIYAWFNDISSKIELRHNSVLIDMPDFTNKILILTGAGMTLRAALIKIADEMSLDTPLYRTLQTCVQMMKNGETDEKALDFMTIQCNTPQMRRFTSVVAQNMKRGGTDVVAALQDIGAEQWAERKATAMRISAEADTKLLFPMMLMLFSVILITIAPAVMGMNV